MSRKIVSNYKIPLFSVVLNRASTRLAVHKEKKRTQRLTKLCHFFLLLYILVNFLRSI